MQMDALAAWAASSPLLAATAASLVGGFVPTTLGAVPVLFLGRLQPRTSNSLLALSAGVMLAATIFSLLLRVSSWPPRCKAAGSSLRSVSSCCSCSAD